MMPDTLSKVMGCKAMLSKILSEGGYTVTESQYLKTAIDSLSVVIDAEIHPKEVME